MTPLRRVRVWLGLFIAGLVLSGLTAFPLVAETRVLADVAGPSSVVGARFPDLAAWLARVHQGLEETGDRYPFIAYGSDWLAFAHLVIAVAFVGPWRDPVKNRWVIEFGIVACVLVIPLALVCGPIRGIPWFWRLIDCSFGVFGAIPLIVVWRLVRKMEGDESAPGDAAA